MKYWRQLTISLLLLPTIAKADLATDSGLNSTANLIPGLIKTTDTRVVIASVIAYALQWVGILFIILIIYGGVRWMTARGNSQQVDEAKNVVKNAAIGLAIVLLSYVITRFVVTFLDKGSTGATGTDVIGQ